MPLDIKRIEFFLERINEADTNTFSSSINQLFVYLEQEVKNNEKYIYYENEREKWRQWPRGVEFDFGDYWKMPDNYQESKSLGYDVYKSIAEKKDDGMGLPHLLFNKSHIQDNIYEFNKTFMPYLESALRDILEVDSIMATNNKKNITGNKVFIIHGHDNALKREVQLLLARADLDDVVLHEKPDKNRSIIDKLIEEGAPAAYVIALLSPDDLQADGKYRARQNVILEIGYFLGKLGKERVRMLVKKGIEIPSDLRGILYEPYDDAGNWRMKLLKEIEAVGIEVNIKKVLEKY